MIPPSSRPAVKLQLSMIARHCRVAFAPAHHLDAEAGQDLADNPRAQLGDHVVSAEQA
jgi:hypothetical protein